MKYLVFEIQPGMTMLRRDSKSWSAVFVILCRKKNAITRENSWPLVQCDVGWMGCSPSSWNLNSACDLCSVPSLSSTGTSMIQKKKFFNFFVTLVMLLFLNYLLMNTFARFHDFVNYQHRSHHQLSFLLPRHLPKQNPSHAHHKDPVDYYWHHLVLISRYKY